MRRIPLRRPSPAMVVACIALTLSLAGTSYATVSLARDSVGTVQIKDNAVTSQKIRDFSLRQWDFKRGQVPRGVAGPQGPPGPPGPAGGLASLILHEGSVAVPANAAGNGLYATRAIGVRCSAGERAIAGGTSWSLDKDDTELITIYSRPLMENRQAVGWRARGGSDLNATATFTVQVLCAVG
jgi:hypothetical protein